MFKIAWDEPGNLARTRKFLNTYPNWENIKGSILGNVNDMALGWSKSNLYGIQDAYVVTTEGTTLRVYHTTNISASTVTWTLQATFSMADSSVTTSARIATSRTVPNFAIVAWRSRTGTRVARTIDGETWGTAVVVGDTTSDGNYDGCDIGLAVDGNNQLVTARHTDGKYYLYLATSSGSNFSRIITSPASDAPYPLIVTDGRGNCYARQKSDETGGNINETPTYTIPFDTSLPIAITSPEGVVVSSGGNPGHCLQRTRVYDYTACWGEGCFSCNAILDFGSSKTIYAVAWDTFLNSNIAATIAGTITVKINWYYYNSGWQMAAEQTQSVNPTGEGNVTLEYANMWHTNKLISETGLNTAKIRLSIVYENDCGVTVPDNGQNDIIRFDNIKVYTVPVSIANGINSLFRIDNYETAPVITDIIPTNLYLPDYPYSLTVDVADSERISIVADNGTIQKRLTSPDRGTTWADNGSTNNLHGLKLRGRGLSLFGGGSLKYSDDFGQTLEDKTGNWSSVFSSVGVIRGLLDPAQDGLLPCPHEGPCACPANHAAYGCETSAYPLSLHSGEKLEIATDLSCKTPAGDLAFTRYYRQSKQTDSRYQFMGLGWTHNHQINLTEDTTVTPNVIILRFNGGETHFTRVGITNQYEGDPGSSSLVTVDPASDYDAGTEAARYTITMADKSVFLFDSNKVLRRRKWSNGEYWDYAYDGSNNLVAVTDAAYQLAASPAIYRQLTFSYQNGKLYRVTDHTGRYVELAYTNNLLTSITDVRGNDWRYEYGMAAGGLNLMTKVISPKLVAPDESSRITLKELIYTVDGSGQVTAISERLGLKDPNTPQLVTDFVFQANGENITTETTGGFTQTHRFSGGVYEGVEAHNANGQYAKQRLNDRYRPEEQQDANGNTTQLEWGAGSKQLTKVLDAHNQATTFAYSNDLLSSSVDAQGRQTVYTYGDTVNNPRLPTLIEVKNSANELLQKQSFVYGAKGRVLTEQTVDPAANTVLRQISREYHLTGDGNGLLSVMQQHDAEALTSTLDTEYLYDRLGRVIKTSQHSTFGSCQYSYTVYDAAGNVEATVCGRYNVVTPPTSVAAAQAMYDANHPVKKDNRVTVHQYDALGRRVATTVNAGSAFEQTTLTCYDALNRVWRTISNYINQSGGAAEAPALWVWNNGWKKSDGSTPISHGDDHTQNLIQDTVYNARGLVESQMDIAGHVTRLVYNAAGRVVRTISNYVPEGSSDPAVWVWANNRWEYGAGLPVNHGNNDQNLIVEQEYDAVGNAVKTRDPLRNVTLTGYDELNRPVKTIRNASQPNYDILADLDLSAYSAYSAAADQDLVETTDYDALGRVVRTQRLVSIEDAVKQWDTTLYGYDSLGRQVKVIRAASIPDYGFAQPDLAGYGGYVDNLSVPDQDIVSLTAYNPAGQVVFTEDALHRQTYFVYDGFGRQIKTITNYVPQGDSDPATWTWSAARQQWERSLTNQTPIEHGGDNDQNLIQETFYDSDGKVLATRDLLGRVNRNVYENGRLKLSVANLTAADPSTWVWTNNRWEDGSGNLVEHGPANDQNSITETLYDAQGRVEATRDGLGRVSRQVFDDLGRVIRTVTNYLDQGEDPVLWVWNNGWKKSDGTTPISHGADNDQNIVSRTVYDTQGRVAQTIDHRNTITRYVYDSLSRRVKTIASYLEQGTPVTDPANWVWVNNSWEDGSGNPIEFGTDNDQNRITTTTYDLAGRVICTRDAAGIETHFEYDAFGRRTQTITNYVVQGSSNPANWVWDLADKRWEDGSGNPIGHGSAFDQNLMSASHYNKSGQVVETTDVRGTQTRFVYDRAARRINVIQAAGTALESQSYTCYDKAGRVLRTIANWTNDPAQFGPDAKDTSGNWQFVPPHNGVDNDRDLVTVFDYDLAGRRTQVTDPLGNATVTTYFKDGQVQSVTDPENGVTQYRYDGLRRRTRVVQGFVGNGEDPALWWWDEQNTPNPQWEKFDGTAIHSEVVTDENIIVDVTYDKAGRVLSQRDPCGNVTTYQYDKLNRRKTLTNPISQTWSTVYSDLTDGKTRTTMTYPGLADTGNYPVQRDFDRLGRLREIHYHPGGTPPFGTPQVNFVYDEVGNRKQMIESNGVTTVRQTEFGYDALHRLSSIGFDDDGDGAGIKTVSYEYDAGGLRTKLSLPDNLSVTYTYDQRGQLVSLTDWDDQPTQFAYDLVGRHIATERANGLGSRYEYDATGRLRHLRHQERNKVLARFQYQVDGSGNRTQVFEQVAHLSAVVATLDKANAAVEYYQGVWADSGAFKVTTQFEAAMRVTFTGNEARLTLSTGPDHSIFDIYVDGSLWESFDGYASTAGERQINLYLTRGGLHVVNIRNRPERNAGNSTESSVYQIGFKQLEVLETTYDQQTIQYEYDALARLLDAKYFPGTDMGATILRRHQFTYDRAGNRLSEAVALNGGTPTVTSYTYNNANQLTGDGTSTYAYDPNGNLWKTNDVVTHTWDRANRLLSMGGASYQYDGLDNRVQQTVGADVTRYLLDLQPGLAVVLAATKGTETTRYVHSPRGIHAQQDPQNEWDWMVQDGLGSVRGVVNNAADVLESRLYSPYGEPFGGSMTTDPNYNSPVYGFTGEPTDDNGLLYLRARYYNPNLGVFTALDPFEGMADRPMSLNGYSWVEANPINNVDASGRRCNSWKDLQPGGKHHNDDYYHYITCGDLEKALYTNPNAPPYETVINCYLCAMEGVPGWEIRSPESYGQGLRRAGIDEMKGADAARIEANIVQYEREYGPAPLPVPELKESILELVGLDDGYFEGVSVGASAKLGYWGVGVQFGIELVYNFSTFQRMTFTFGAIPTGAKDINSALSKLKLSGDAQLAAYVGFLNGFTWEYPLNQNRLPTYDHFVGEYGGLFDVYGISATSVLGGSIAYFQSPNGLIKGATAGINAGVGVGLSVGTSGPVYSPLEGNSKTYINSATCLVDQTAIESDIRYGFGASPINSIGSIIADIPMSPFRERAITAVGNKVRIHNWEVTNKMKKCQC